MGTLENNGNPMVININLPSIEHPIPDHSGRHMCLPTLKIAGIIDEVNAAMLENILTEENDAFVFFYDKTDPEAHTILEELEQGLYSVLS